MEDRVFCIGVIIILSQDGLLGVGIRITIKRLSKIINPIILFKECKLSFIILPNSSYNQRLDYNINILPVHEQSCYTVTTKFFYFK